MISSRRISLTNRLLIQLIIVGHNDDVVLDIDPFGACVGTASSVIFLFLLGQKTLCLGNDFIPMLLGLTFDSQHKSGGTPLCNILPLTMRTFRVCHLITIVVSREIICRR